MIRYMLLSQLAQKHYARYRFAEAHVAMVVRCKKLFQASVDPTTYGSSATNAFIHTVWMRGIKLVIASNCWKQELENVAPEVRNWITENSVYVYVDTPLWIQ